MQVDKTIKIEEVIKFNETSLDLVLKTIKKLEERFGKDFVYEQAIIEELIALEQAVSINLSNLKEALNE